MRFQRLDILKYGKFSERSIEFPNSTSDFHLIVGPNEAGKSTLRSAILDLLFGIPTRSPHGFLHPLNELRLGASISDGTHSLEFNRIKAQKQTLRTLGDVPLPDSALTPFLGSVDRNFFDQMFGLDHFRLVDGGNSILNAESDIGQILFQSAAGVAGLGKVRDELAAEADKLWGPRRSLERAYFMAAEQLDQANDALKRAVVRTKVWAEANAAVESLRETVELERRKRLDLDKRRAKLERVRRLAPLVQTLRQDEASLEALKATPDLPADAAATLAEAEREISRTDEFLRLRTADVEDMSNELAAISIDAAILSSERDISELDRRRIQYSAYDRDIERRKNEIASLLEEVQSACIQLQWTSESADDVRQRLPSLLLRRKLGQLARDASGLQQASKAADASERSKKSDIESLEEQLQTLPDVPVTSGLRAALFKARSLGDAEATVEKHRVLMEKAEASLEAAMQALGTWRREADELSKLQLPSNQSLARHLEQKQNLEAEIKSLAKSLAEQSRVVAAAALQVSQFTEVHHPTTFAQVQDARSKRDSKWETVKQRTNNFDADAGDFEDAMRHTDELADTHLSNVEDATELQSRIHQHEKERQAKVDLEQEVETARRNLQAFDIEWVTTISQAGLAGMSLENTSEWIQRRDSALKAGESLLDAQMTHASATEVIADTTQRLSEALRENGVVDEVGDNLAALCIRAEQLISKSDGTDVRRETLNSQLLSARQAYALLQDEASEARKEVDHWNTEWATNLSSAGLNTSNDTGAVEGALELITQIEEKLRKIRQIQSERIDAMNADLASFSNDASVLCSAIAPALEKRPPSEAVQQLVISLQQAKEAQATKDRVEEALRISEAQVARARGTKQEAVASIAPLMMRAGVTAHEALSEAIAKSDEKRRLLAEITRVGAEFANGGDGLTREQVEAEIHSTDLTQVAAELQQLSDDLTAAIERQSLISAELGTAEKVLIDIGGSHAAALAEGQRQEALARMADAAERYVKVFTASRLLRWSIDRYREEKQGPMLAKASAIFSALTLGSFQRLVVDFERQPMALEGQRPDGRFVSVPCMSDGTRDQLFLALRLAALETRLEHATALPFIADDLFVNYDDERAKAGLRALASVSKHTQVIFLTHHDHMKEVVRDALGEAVNMVQL